MPATAAITADIFCRVVDNFGDIGVCWRLARGLTAEHGWHVRLWVDDLHSFARLAPTLDVQAPRQMLDAVEVMAWRDAAPHAVAGPLMPRDVVIEAFACDPPAGFVTAMQAMATPPVWINLEYLSAEDWIEGCHGLHSRRPDGLEKIFCFPGFTTRTGGLLRERDLLLARDRFQADPNAQDTLLKTCGVPANTRTQIAQGAAAVSLFCYPDAPLQALFAALAQRHRPTVLIAPYGVAPQAESALAALPLAERAQLMLCRIPFVPHEAFDRLLWLADLNVVRGEDSLVRALWAGRPLLWHIYPQEDAAHEVKLNAFLARTGWPEAAQDANRAFNGAALLNRPSGKVAPLPAQSDWPEARAAEAADFALVHDETAWQAWHAAAQRYAATVAAHRDLATTIADYGVRATD